MKHRRDFIKTTSAAMIALGVAPATLAAKPLRTVGRRRSAPLSDLHYADFAEHVNTPFLIKGSSGAFLPLLLAEAQDKSNRLSGENFSVVFQGPSNQALSQGTYEFEHRWLGAFYLFIVPMRRDGRTARYEAIFNRVA